MTNLHVFKCKFFYSRLPDQLHWYHVGHGPLYEAVLGNTSFRNWFYSHPEHSFVILVVVVVLVSVLAEIQQVVIFMKYTSADMLV